MDQDKVLFTLESPIEWLRQELEEERRKSDERDVLGVRVGDSSGAVRFEQRDVSRDDGKMLDSREQESVKRSRTCTKVAYVEPRKRCKSVRGSVSIF